MQRNLSKILLFLLVAVLCLAASDRMTAQESPNLLKAKKAAEAKGLTFIASRDEIIAQAKKEGRLRVLFSLTPDSYPHISKAFKQKYPFIDLHLEEITGTDAAQRFLMELQAGVTRDWDIFRVSPDFYNELAGHAKKIDLLGMAEHQVLRIPPQMIDPARRNVMHAGSALGSMAYNKELISQGRVPNTWEDFLKPELKGRKFLVDIRPLNFAPFAAALGEEWLVNYARRLKEQEPVWVRGHTRALTAMVSGEYALYQLTNYHSCALAQQQDPRKVLVCKLIEPIPVRLTVPQAIVHNAPRPYSALLFLEFLASREAQKIMDDVEPLKSSIYAPGSELENITKAKKVALETIDSFPRTEKRIDMVVEAFGFPKAEKK